MRALSRACGLTWSLVVLLEWGLLGIGVGFGNDLIASAQLEELGLVVTLIAVLDGFVYVCVSLGEVVLVCGADVERHIDLLLL